MTNLDELNRWIDEAQDTVKFLQREINGIKSESQQKLKNMEKSLNWYSEEMRGLHQLQKFKTQVKEDMEGYLLKCVSKLPQFQKAVKTLEEGGDCKLNLELKMKQKELPLELKIDGRGTITREIQGTNNDEITREKVEESLKTKSIVKDKDGIRYEE